MDWVITAYSFLIGTAIPTAWALIVAHRQKIIISELSNFDFWVVQTASKKTDAVLKLCSEYEEAKTDGHATPEATYALRRLSSFIERTLDRYDRVAYGPSKNISRSWQNHIATTTKVRRNFTSAKQKLDEDIKSEKAIQVIFVSEDKVEESVSDLIMHLRQSISMGKGIFSFWVIRAKYWKH